MVAKKLFIAAAAALLPFMIAAPALAQANIQSGLCTGADLTITDNPTDNCADNNSTDHITNLVHEIINILSTVVGIVAVVMIIIGGLRYVTSGGNDASVTSAKNTILYAIIGLIIVALSQVLVHFTLSRVTNG